MKWAKRVVKVINALYEDNKAVYENANVVLKTSGKATSAAVVGNDKIELLLNQIKVIEAKIIATQSITETLKVRSQEIKKYT